MISPSKKLISLFLVFSLMMLSVNLYAKERRGAKLIITKTDGQRIKGELITVKPNSLLLLDTEGKDVSVDIEDIKVIRVGKKSKFLLGTGLGLLIGGGLALIGEKWARPEVEEKGMFAGLGRGLLFFSAGVIVVCSGALIGASAGKDETIQLEGMPPAFIEHHLQKLRKKARIRDYK